MKILELISEKSTVDGMPFLVHGGVAVIAHGHNWSNIDLDLIIRDEDEHAWSEFFGGLGYLQTQSVPGFRRFESDTMYHWATDLMLVDRPTFDALMRQAEVTLLGRATFYYPCALHMLAMKLHSMAQGNSNSKDAYIIKDILGSRLYRIPTAALEALIDRFRPDSTRMARFLDDCRALGEFDPLSDVETLNFPMGRLDESDRTNSFDWSMTFSSELLPITNRNRGRLEKFKNYVPFVLHEGPSEGREDED